ncbi:MAG: type II/IV secretion system ATPase subunit [Infirmifilum sp.]
MDLKSLRLLFAKKTVQRIGINAPPPRDLLVPAVSLKGHKEITSYDVEEGYSRVKIFQNLDEGGYLYFVIEPQLTARESRLLSTYLEEIKEKVPPELRFREDTSFDLKKKRLRKYIVNRALSDGFSRRSGEKVYYYLYRDMFFFGPLSVPILDTNMVEDITMTQGRVFIFHKLYGSISSNIVIPEAVGEELIRRIAEIGKKSVSYVEPLVDASLPDGSRFQAIASRDVVLTGPSITIRKFSEKPFTPIDIIRTGEASPEIYAYLWLLVEYSANIMIVGGTATGKTTFLNSLLMFVKPFSKIISLEDTREINLYHDNWVPMVTRDAIGIINAQGMYEKVGEITLMDLLKASLRQRPEYIVVGEVRGPEAIHMFQAMATGKTGYTTFHADSIESAIHRLTQPPLNVPHNHIQNIDVFVILRHTVVNQRPTRRVMEVAEFFLDPDERRMKINPFFVWNYQSDTFEMGLMSEKIKRISVLRGIPMDTLYQMMNSRAEKLREMLNSGKQYDVKGFTSEIMQYYRREENAVLGGG